MNNNILITSVLVVAIVFCLPWAFKFRRVFLVPEGYAGLLYQR